MIFEGLADKLQGALGKLKSKGKLTEKDVKDAMREVKLALLEADVNFKVVKDFVKKVQERAVGQDVMESLTPAQHVIKIVNEELTSLMGDVQSKIMISPKPPTVIMMVGLQGAGKTTTSGKLGGYFKKQGKKPLLVACDIYRPAAIKQLQVVGEKLDIPVFSMGDKESPVNIAKAGYNHAVKNNHDLVIIDTAGRLHIDETLMEELQNIKSEVKPHEILLVVDSMTGQDAVNVAQSFNDALGVDGVVLTKLDGDTRGGAALSIRAVTQKPIKFIGMGEKLDDLEPFHPDRMASRILGMGDILSLIEKAQENIDLEKAKELESKIKKQDLDFEDFLEQMEQIQKMGPLNKVIEMIPGMGQVKDQLGDIDMNNKEIVRTKAIVQSMTIEERRNPSILNASRKKRIARGSGTSVQDVNRLIKQFDEMKKMMKMFTGTQKSMKKRGGFAGLPFFK
ncbi:MULTISPECIES: signal recognition particle protein [Paraclostridium]|jgi:signal recognition particle subunit SRP54|uniref:Signal recognition particle protein n=3 Tax=Paraclostridium TaxID=1849822 RepID=A0A0M3DK65_9FIRM|nr:MULTISPECIES: signal recognition particle protein [Paraclostridium]KGJ50247.1 signal recognition particle [Clostridium sp. NCR]MDV8108692.1 signal recognition particle protein [Bacillus sp. BAU-SS-2023]RDC50525.1 signal recognition particle protein [Acinetobacter sp. RIT592]EQK43748.1 signal recognition particle protein [[Clostridium] bifermentans ATCC 638] [Paraclostridium bifermentans ATCC 638 = DSM 14991]EQK45951.1 signal recognition particle protein [[Clostridium] bifermentans ATCC 1929